MGFDPEWLALREPADHAARDATLLGRAVTAAGPAPVILDLACGTGSTLRAVAPHMQVHAVWRLVDNDLALLEHARDCGPEEVE
ncbi:MAG: class I SAM-dependent methyltransferase, partial [Pseudomonadota bacterium]